MRRQEPRGLDQAGAPLHAFDYRHRGSMAAIGHLNGVAGSIGPPVQRPVRLAALARLLPDADADTGSRKLRIFIEWSWGALFPIDITHLRFTRSRDVMMPPLD